MIFTGRPIKGGSAMPPSPAADTLDASGLASEERSVPASDPVPPANVAPAAWPTYVPVEPATATTEPELEPAPAWPVEAVVPAVDAVAPAAAALPATPEVPDPFAACPTAPDAPELPLEGTLLVPGELEHAAKERARRGHPRSRMRILQRFNDMATSQAANPNPIGEGLPVCDAQVEVACGF
jgi:hypothetical protein